MALSVVNARQLPTMEDPVCTAAPVPDRAPPKSWHGRGGCAGSMGLSRVEALAEQKRVRELLGPKPRALLTHARGLNSRRHGVWGSSAAPWRSRTNNWFGIELRQEAPLETTKAFPLEMSSTPCIISVNGLNFFGAVRG
jgi:hypothetical protein